MNQEELVNKFLWILKVEKRISLNTYKSYGYDLKVFFEWLLNNVSFKIEDPDIIMKFYSYLKEEKNNEDSSITRKINVLMKFLTFCNEECAMKFIIPEKKNKKLTKTYRTFLESEDLEKIRTFLNQDISENNERLLCIVEVLYSTGLRVSELIKLKIIDIYEIEKNRSLLIKGKGDVMRIIFFSDLCIQSIKNYLSYLDSKKDYLFPLTRQRIFQLLKNLAQKLEIDISKVFPHSFRHRLLTDLVQKGMNLINVQKIAGHKQISTTEKYTHVEDYLYEEIYKYHPLVKKMK